jgi:hypothetical protein
MARSAGLDEMFKEPQFDREIIVLLRALVSAFKLSYRDLVEMMAERGLSLAHTTMMRWVQRAYLGHRGLPLCWGEAPNPGRPTATRTCRQLPAATTALAV